VHVRGLQVWASASKVITLGRRCSTRPNALHLYRGHTAATLSHLHLVTTSVNLLILHHMDAPPKQRDAATVRSQSESSEAESRPQPDEIISAGNALSASSLDPDVSRVSPGRAWLFY